MKWEKTKLWFADSLLASLAVTAGVWYGIKMVNYEVISYPFAVWLYCVTGMIYLALTTGALWLGGGIDILYGQKMGPLRKRILLVILSFVSASLGFFGLLVALGHLKAATTRSKHIHQTS